MQPPSNALVFSVEVGKKRADGINETALPMVK